MFRRSLDPDPNPHQDPLRIRGETFGGIRIRIRIKTNADPKHSWKGVPMY
jgi:hypothetical protein